MDVCRHVSEVATGQEDTDAIKAVLLTIQLAIGPACNSRGS